MFSDLLTTDVQTAEEFARRCEVFCRRIARRDLRGVPLYIVPTSMLDQELVEAAGEIGGWTGLETDLVVRPYLRAWRGRGPAMVVSMRYCEQWQFERRCGVSNSRASAQPSTPVNPMIASPSAPDRAPGGPWVLPGRGRLRAVPEPRAFCT